VTENEFVQLLYRGESESLDFKSEQYVFVGASEEAMTELLKDILAFANAWRNDPAYILIGVQETPSRKANATGISPADHIDDATLQQFVNSSSRQHVVVDARRSDGKDGGRALSSLWSRSCSVSPRPSKRMKLPARA
jgi:predicted HTH transcriptional regulator